MKTSTINHQLIEKARFRHATIFLVKDSPQIVIIKATSKYIPIEQFKEIFEAVSTLSKTSPVRKLIFDKTSLTVFHQPSMEWYFVHWKEQMFDAGLTHHRKILPNDDVFRQSVRIGREKIDRRYPNGKYHQMDIRYSDSIEDAIKD